MAKGVVAPRGSPFVDENNRLTPAWHHYLANVEELATDLTITLDGNRLLALEVRIEAMELIVTQLEADYRKRNWAFTYDGNMGLNGGGQFRLNHNLNTLKVIARCVAADQGTHWNSYLTQPGSVTKDSIDLQNVATSGGASVAQGWALGFYDDLQ